ncbi:MAG: choice-of-anchor D domain-containing protein [Candidatus Sulfotelmatobacter sp.]
MKLNRSGCSNVQPQICVSLVVLFVLCLAFSPVAGQAQTYKANDIYTVVGGGKTPTNPALADLPGVSAAIENPSTGTIYIAAPDSAYVFDLTSAGVFGNYAGLGYGGHNTDGRQASTALIYEVTGLAIDGSGNIYFADAAGSRIRKVSPTGVISTVAGNGDKCDHAEKCGDGGLAIDANLNLPESVALDTSGNLYIADAGDNRIRVVNVTKSPITIAGVLIGAGDINSVAGTTGDITGCSDPQTGCGDGGLATKATLNFPYGVALDTTNNIYISDTDDQRVRVVNPQATAAITIFGISIPPGIIETVAGNGIGCSNPVSNCGDNKAPTSAEVDVPRGIFLDAANDLLIADTGDSRIRLVSATTNLISTVVNTAGTAGYSGDGGPAASAQINLPSGIWVDSHNDYFVSDSGNELIRVVNNQTTAMAFGGTLIQPGDIQTIAGGGNGLPSTGTPPTSAQLALPWDAAEDAAGNLYIVDQGNNRILKVSVPAYNSTATISVFAGNNRTGSCVQQTPPSPPICTGDGGAATSASLNGPSSVAFDPTGNMYIADSNNLVIREVVKSTGDIQTVAGNGGSCYPTTATCGDGGVATSASFSFPLNITFDLSGDLYISDWQGYKIRKVVPSGGSIANGTISTIAGTGVSGSKGNNGPATSANLDHPAGLVVDSSANVYISDQYNGEVRQVVEAPNASTCSQVTGDICQWALNEDAKLSGDGLTKLDASMWNPLELAIDPSNNVYISGGNNNVVQRISAATGIFSNVAGNPTNSIQGGYSGDKGPATNAKMANLGAWVDASGNLYIADGGNNRVRYVPLAPAATYTPTSLALGQWALGVTGSSLPVTLSSTGGEDLSLTPITFTGANSGDFSQTNTCGTTVSPNDSCTINVSLTPSAYGPESATMSINDNATGGAQTVTLTGSGPNFSISASPNTISVAPGATGTSTITLTPQAKFAQIVAVSCTGAPVNSTCSLSNSDVQMYGGTTSTTTLSIVTTTGTAAGTYTLTVTGTYAPLSNSTTITLTVQ